MKACEKRLEFKGDLAAFHGLDSRDSYDPCRELLHLVAFSRKLGQSCAKVKAGLISNHRHTQQGAPLKLKILRER